MMMLRDRDVNNSHYRHSDSFELGGLDGLTADSELYKGRGNPK